MKRDVLVGSIEQEDESNDSMGCVSVLTLSKEGRADSLEGEEDEHANDRAQEKNPATNLVHQEGSEKRPEQIPYLEDAVDEELDGGISDTNSVQDTCKVVGDKAIARPLREEGDSNNDSETPQVTGCGKKGFPADIICHSAVEFDSSLDLLKFKLDQWILAE